MRASNNEPLFQRDSEGTQMHLEHRAVVWQFSTVSPHARRQMRLGSLLHARRASFHPVLIRKY